MYQKKDPNKNKSKMLSYEFLAIYLIFDNEPHYQKFSIEKLLELQTFFNDYLDKGLLLINYPMLEAFKHLGFLPDKQFLTLAISKEEVKNYKAKVGEESKYYDFTKYFNELVKNMIIRYLIKMNILINNEKKLPTSKEVAQMIINRNFTKQ